MDDTTELRGCASCGGLARMRPTERWGRTDGGFWLTVEGHTDRCPLLAATDGAWLELAHAICLAALCEMLRATTRRKEGDTEEQLRRRVVLYAWPAYYLEFPRTRTHDPEQVAAIMFQHARLCAVQLELLHGKN